MLKNLIPVIAFLFLIGFTSNFAQEQKEEMKEQKMEMHKDCNPENCEHKEGDKSCCSNHGEHKMCRHENMSEEEMSKHKEMMKEHHGEMMENKEMHKDMMDKKNDSQTKAGAMPFNKICPVKGNPVDPEVTVVEYNGQNYGFCCSGCDEKFKADPEKYSKNLNEDGTEFLKD